MHGKQIGVLVISLELNRKHLDGIANCIHIRDDTFFLLE